jgi:hypothetical protein
MWRQGDVLIEAIHEIPRELKRIKRLILAAGDSTAQRHQIKERGVAQLFQDNQGQLFLVVTAQQAVVVHPEHNPIVLPKGNYRVWRQREFNPVRPRTVVD